MMWIRFHLAAVAALCLLLTGCATTIQSDVTAFHAWPAELSNKSFAFTRTAEQENNLEHRAYENLVRQELQRLGLEESTHPQLAALKVTMRYNVDIRDVRVVQPVAVNPWYVSPFLYGPHWRGYGYYGPYYGPLWYTPPIVQQHETLYQLATRQLKIVISRAADGKNLYDVTATSEGTNKSLAAVMPYMIRSAFAEFPGKNGVPRRIELKMTD